MNISKNNQPLLWGLLHGVNDLVAGFILAHYTLQQDYSNSFLYITLYAIIGFGGQLPVGFWLDSSKQLKPFANASLILLPIAALTAFISLPAAIIISGISSAFVHVTGGAVCLQVHNNKTGPLGIFTAPGVLGLTAGSIIGQYTLWPLAIIAAVAMLTGLIISKTELPVYKTPEKKQSELDSHDFIMLTVLLLMCFRSFLYDVINYSAEYFEDGVLYIGLSAFAGKIIGGFIADKIGVKKFIYISMLAALLLFQFGKENIYTLCMGVACLQSSVPVTLLLMGRSLPIHPATATALTLGTSIALAGLPLYLVTDKEKIFSHFNNPLLTAGVFLIFILLWIFLFMRWRKQKNIFS
jgi:MFS transporter, FSR family, fosmidomycin resistance protein